jgi:predicted nuclease of predicted toxin-antitoxin system
MKIFLDENMPRKLTPALRALGHEVESVHTLSLDGTANGELYRMVVFDYDLCFTRDKEFAEKSGESPIQGRVKVIHVTLKQQPQDAYVSAFMTDFPSTQWDAYANGDDWL